MKSDLDKSIDSLESTSDNSTPEPVRATVKSSRKPKVPLVAPSSEELDAFYESLSECRTKTVCLSLEKPYANCFISKTRLEHQLYFKFA